ncbi:hypothetical protein BEN44_14595 [Leptospira interrogans serovar Ricardi]|nr:hypothetical protein [Leptospira interrogans serovar Ricardi]
MLLKARFVIFHDYLELVGTITNQGFNRLDLKLWEHYFKKNLSSIELNSYSKVRWVHLNLIILFLSKRKVKLILGYVNPVGLKKCI